VDVMGWCYVVILIEFCIVSICLLWLYCDYRKDKNRNINTFDCFSALLLTMVRGGLTNFFVYGAKTLGCLGW
jgi:hypothetical protein